MTDVRRLVEGLAVDGLLALDDGGEVHQPTSEMPPVKLDSSLPETENCVCKRCNLQARLWIRIQRKTKQPLKKENQKKFVPRCFRDIEHAGSFIYKSHKMLKYMLPCSYGTVIL